MILDFNLRQRQISHLRLPSVGNNTSLETPTLENWENHTNLYVTSTHQILYELATMMFIETNGNNELA